MPPDQVILAFDTSAAHCAAALLSGDQVTTRVDEMARGQAEHLIPMLEEMLAEAGLRWSDLTALAVGVGPGNFTGIRISVSVARGLALGLAIPALGVTAFDVARNGSFGAATLPAPRGQAYLELVSGPARLVAETEVPETAIRLSDIPVADQIARMARIAAGRMAGAETRFAPPAPYYVRPADAAPSSDPPPVILP